MSIKKYAKNGLSLICKISPKINSKMLFFIRTHERLNLGEPKTFNDKTTYLKLYQYSNNDLVTNCADKYMIREYVEQKGCKEILNDLYFVYDDVNQIDWNELPQKFALKCTHGCAYNIICSNKDTLNIKKSIFKINMWMKEKYGYATSELQYTKIKPRIIVEKYLCDDAGKMPIDYKFYCFNGKVKTILVCSEREKKLCLNYYDLNWNEQDYAKEMWKGKKDIPKPKNLNKMIEYAEKLSAEFPFVRVDLYNKNGEIIFGELTFTPACCCAPYYSKKGNVELGSFLEIKRIGVIGHFGGEKQFLDGQTVKTKEINNYIEKYFKIKTSKFDTYKNARNPFKLFFLTKKMIKGNDNIFLIVSSRGYKILMPLLTLFNKFYKRKMFDFVIGGNRYSLYDNNKKFIKMANGFEKIYVETNNLKKLYNIRGINNAEVLANFKDINIVKRTKFIKKEKIKLCTFSRVCKEKGIEDAIETVKYANQKLNKEVFSLDIYGMIDNNYKEKFANICSKFPDYIKYCGTVDSSHSTEILCNYDILLFLTFWKGEGFPGTLIDALFSGLPTIATDWNCNFEILKENYTGKKVEINNPKIVAEILIEMYQNQVKLQKMSENCIFDAKEYLPDNLMKNVIKELK